MDNLGPNMRRLTDTVGAESVVTRVVAGPGDLLTWEVSARFDSGELPLEAIGRGGGLEAAAAELLRVVSLHSPHLLDQPEISDEE